MTQPARDDKSPLVQSAGEFRMAWTTNPHDGSVALDEKLPHAP